MKDTTSNSKCSENLLKVCNAIVKQVDYHVKTVIVLWLFCIQIFFLLDWNCIWVQKSVRHLICHVLFHCWRAQEVLISNSNSGMRTVTNYFLLNLSVADISISLFCTLNQVRNRIFRFYPVLMRTNIWKNISS